MSSSVRELIKDVIETPGALGMLAIGSLLLLASWIADSPLRVGTLILLDLAAIGLLLYTIGVLPLGVVPL